MGRREKSEESSFQLPGLYDAMLDRAIEDVERGDPRVKYPEYTPGLSESERQQLNATSPVTLAAKCRLDKLSQGEPVDLAASALGWKWHDVFPVQRDGSVKTVRVHSDDRVEVVEYR
jgi:hypothetical protein